MGKEPFWIDGEPGPFFGVKLTTKQIDALKRTKQTVDEIESARREAAMKKHFEILIEEYLDSGGINRWKP